MKALKIFVHAVVIGCLSVQSSVALALDNDSIYGTHSVVFQPVQRGGNLQGCSLLYKAVQTDFPYLNGGPVMILGNIGLQQYGFNVILTLKIGVKSVMDSTVIVRPNFAYLQTKSYSTAKVKQQSYEGDEGYRLYAYSLWDASVMNLFNEMMNSKKIIVAFTRKKDGLDVLVPVDLDVIDAEYPGGDIVVRKRSKETLENFTNCFLTLTEQAKRSLDKK